MLAVLALAANRAVPIDRLVDLTWPVQPPRRAAHAVRVCVSGLRAVLGQTDAEINTEGGGYALRVEPAAVDVYRFRSLVDQARVGPDDPGRVALLDEALALWRGPALAGVVPAESRDLLCHALDEARLLAIEDRLDARLRLGQHRLLLDELTGLVQAHPARERLVGQLMLALHRDGRAGAALAAYRELRQRLADEAGIDPGADVRQLELAILRDDPELAAPELPPGPHPQVPAQLPPAVAGFTGRADYLARLDELTAGHPPGPATSPEPGKADGPDKTDQVGGLERTDQVDGADAAGGAGGAEGVGGGGAVDGAGGAEGVGGGGAVDGAGGVTRAGGVGGGGGVGGAVVVTAIGGSAGIGKTALAVQWAHGVRGRFPGGQLYVNLNGHAATPPMRPVDALARFLRALGVPAEQVPVEADEAAALYRSTLAGTRTLVLLDNAATPEQVRPLLPGDPGCLVLVTSRDRLSGLAARDGAQRLTLDVLTPAESVALLAAVLDGDRVAAEPRAAAELARACGHLPLALRIVGAHLTDHPGRSLAEQAEALAGAGRLAALAVDGDPDSAVRTAFDLSYATLPADARRLFRLLGLVPGPDTIPAAAAALAGATVPEAAGLLDRLAAAHLVGQPAPGRYALHDLLRAYAAGRAEQEDGTADCGAARFRLLDWYLHTAGAAAAQLYPEMLRLALPPPPPGLPPAGITDHAGAVGWLDGELPNLIAAITDAAEHGPRPTAWRLSDTLRGYFWQSRHAVGWLRAAQAGLDAATVEGDRRAQAAAHLSLATAHHSLDRYPIAIAHYTAAADLAGRAGWFEGQVAVLANLGNVHADRGDLRLAADSHQQAFALQRQLNRPAGEAICLSNLGWVHWQLGELRRSADYCADALARHRQAGSPAGEAHALGNLGVVERDLGRLDQARVHLDAALSLHRGIGNRYGEAETLQELAALQRDLGQPDRALATAAAAIGLAREIGDRRIETDVLHVLGTLHPGDAAGYHRQELALARQTGSRWSETTALLGLAAVAADGAAATQALAIARRAGFRALEGLALSTLAGAHFAAGDPARAAEAAEWALAVQQETGHARGLAAARTALAQAEALPVAD